MKSKYYILHMDKSESGRPLRSQEIRAILNRNKNLWFERVMGSNEDHRYNVAAYKVFSDILKLMEDNSI